MTQARSTSNPSQRPSSRPFLCVPLLLLGEVGPGEGAGVAGGRGQDVAVPHDAHAHLRGRLRVKDNRTVSDSLFKIPCWGETHVLAEGGRGAGDEGHGGEVAVGVGRAAVHVLVVHCPEPGEPGPPEFITLPESTIASRFNNIFTN